jgi:hypothetical protein
MRSMVDLDDGGAADTPLLVLRGNLFADTPDGEGVDAHIMRRGRTVTIQDLTIFPGTLTPGRAIRWGLRQLIPHALRGRRALAKRPDYAVAVSTGHHQWVS